MPKVNLQALPRPVRRVETRTFTDPAHPGVEVEVTLRAPDAYDLTRVGVAADEFLLAFKDNCYPLANGEMVQVDESLARVLFSLQLMQPETVVDPYQAEDFLGMLVNMPSAWAALSAWLSEWITVGADQSKNSPKDHTAAGSVSSSPSTASTPTLSTTSGLPSGASTSDLQAGPA